ncbi:Peptidase C19 ubiquitin carboxyl-terminal hydrolase 2 [Penicillium angulare]|uniref:Peptidase C19 ubiquitin carboxyl-terminal hydrolase 2 n=1 Tax=Penicillium angulare TaxID=116970 RepID=UPI0025407C1A|nr:Peptidase C19 ubiquitin carboxyl-terminal hydrolase 2 [Penicillium angulare]KAJ5287637.1 Peptidase C19 ubiquitin carboxyl-terminal hydrolase 2 [Penicillium angulare]
MQEKPTTVAAYAAGASLAAVALFYVFGPNYTIDGDESNDNNRKKSIVGLSNLANDCFINSVLQALAGLGDLRVYLIRELHRRELDGPEVYHAVSSQDDQLRGAKEDKMRELQQGLITKALKEMLDRLNERPIYKKTISARGFIQSLEFAFRTRISRNQQDAQEFLQIVLERLCDEYHAGVRARKQALRPNGVSASPNVAWTESEADVPESPAEVEVRIDDGTPNGLPAIIDTKLKEIENEPGFLFEGKLESQIECQSCHYQYKPNQTSFVNLTLQVPQKSSTTLNACFDGLLKTEYIEDFRCDRCRLQHAIDAKKQEKARTRSSTESERLDNEISRIQEALEKDPEAELKGIVFPPADSAPKRRIARHMRITAFPKVIAIHLSRSIFDRSSSTKNAAKVSFPERLPLGGILNQTWYKVLAIVCHKGSHHSGHYESFRRNNLYAPFSTPEAFGSYAQSRVTSQNPSEAPSPRLVPLNPDDIGGSSNNISPATSSTSLSGASQSGTQLSPSAARPTTSSSRRSFPSTFSRSSTPQPTTSDVHSPTTEAGRASISSAPRSSRTIPRSSVETPTGLGSRLRRRRKANDRWWRISDEKIKECKTSDVLGMQKEVYLLFYEMERPEANPAFAEGRL